jgi:hypothetical protein
LNIILEQTPEFLEVDKSIQSNKNPEKDRLDEPWYSYSPAC